MICGWYEPNIDKRLEGRKTRTKEGKKEEICCDTGKRWIEVCLGA
jgi:hypothetical protein